MSDVESEEGMQDSLVVLQELLDRCDSDEDTDADAQSIERKDSPKNLGEIINRNETDEDEDDSELLTYVEPSIDSKQDSNLADLSLAGSDFIDHSVGLLPMETPPPPPPPPLQKELAVLSSQMVSLPTANAAREAELSGHSTFVRPELDVSKLFYCQNPVVAESPKLVDIAPTVKPASAELTFALARCAALERTIETLNSKNGSPKDDDILRNEVDVHDELASAKVMLEQLVEKNRQLHSQLAEIEESRASDLLALEATRKQLEEKTGLLGELETFHEKIESLSKERDYFASLVSQMKQELDQTKIQLEDAESKSKKLEGQILQIEWSRVESPRNKRRNEVSRLAPAEGTLSPKRVTVEADFGSEVSVPSNQAVVPKLELPVQQPVSSQYVQVIPKPLEINVDTSNESQEEANHVLERLQIERTRFKQAQERIKAANRQSTESLELAMSELRTLEVARRRAEERALVLEQQVAKAQRDIGLINNAIISESVSTEGGGYVRYEASLPLETKQQSLETVNSNSQAHHAPEQQPKKKEFQRTHDNRSQWSFSDMYPAEPEDGVPKRERKQIPEHPQSVNDQVDQNDWASSRESLTPYATEASTKDLQKGFSLLERKLMMINMERERCEAQFDKVNRKGVKTKRALDEKLYLEKRLEELHQEASNVRFALKRQPK